MARQKAHAQEDGEARSGVDAYDVRTCQTVAAGSLEQYASDGEGHAGRSGGNDTGQADGEEDDVVDGSWAEDEDRVERSASHCQAQQHSQGQDEAQDGDGELPPLSHKAPRP